MKLKMFFGFVLILISFSCLADWYDNDAAAYNACMLPSSPSKNCQDNLIDATQTICKNPQYTGYRRQRAFNGSTYALTGLRFYYCGSGGYAITCVSPQVRNANTGICEAPACAPPKFVNAFGICEIPECTTYKVPNVITGACQIPPNCGSTEQYINSSNSCALKSLNCPGHSYANTANDACLPDPKLACPAGQHDDGTYTCIADDALACPSPGKYGFIDGVSQCIAPTGITPEESAAIQAANDARAQADAAETANNDCAAATAWWNDNPTNEARRIDMSNKCAVASSLTNQAASGASREQSTSTKEVTSTLKSVESAITNQTIKDEKRETDKQAQAGGDNCDQPPACVGDPIQCEILKQQHKNSCRSIQDPQLTDKETGGNSEKIAGVFGTGIASDMGTGAFSGQQYVSTGFFNLGSSVCQTIPMNYKLLQYTFDPCTQLQMFRNLLGWFFYMYTAFSIVQLARDTK